jgi:uncharacterized membrane protein YsdA (DUF1294 family)
VHISLTHSLFFFAAINLLSFLSYGWDKYAALRGRWRTPERTLLVLSFLGGPGAIAAIYFFKHKNRKTRYLIFAVPLVILGIASQLWLINRSGIVGG